MKGWNPETLFASGDLCFLWNNHFPGQLSVGAGVFAKMLHTVRGLGTQDQDGCLSWLRPKDQTITLPDVALILDNIGVWRGIAFCTNWEELCGHTYITALRSEIKREQRNAKTAADLIAPRRERLQSVVLPKWNRDLLKTNRPLLQALSALGMSLACDVESGLLLQFEDTDVVRCF